jgi:hypothetical protein
MTEMVTQHQARCGGEASARIWPEHSYATLIDESWYGYQALPATAPLLLVCLGFS